MGADSDRTRELKRRLCHEPALGIGGENKAGQDVLFLKIREVGQDLFVRHTGCEVAENVIHRDPHTSDARVPASQIRIYSDAILVVHTRSLRLRMRRFNENAPLSIPSFVCSGLLCLSGAPRVSMYRYSSFGESSSL